MSCNEYDPLQDMSHPKNTHPNSNINSNIPFFNLHRDNKTVNKWKITHIWRNISIWHLLMNLRNNYLFNKLLMWANKNVRILIFTIKHPIDTRWYHYFTPMYQKSWWWYDRQKLVIMGHFKPFYPIVPVLPLLKTQKMRILKKWKNLLEIPSFYKSVSKTMIIWDMVPEIWSGTDILFCHFEPFFALLPTKQPWKPKFWKDEKSTWRYHHFTQVYHKWKSYEVWFLRYEARQKFLSFAAIFCPFTPLTTPKIKLLKKWKTSLEVSSFNTNVPKIMIICYTVPEIWRVTDLIVNFHFGLFFAILLP